MKWFGVAAVLMVSPAQAKPVAINYSPWHLPGQDPSTGRMPPTEAQIASDLLELWKYTDELRTYSVDAIGQTVIGACQREGMLINVGSFLVREQPGTDPSLIGQTLDIAQNQAINRQVIDSQNRSSLLVCEVSVGSAIRSAIVRDPGWAWNWSSTAICRLALPRRRNRPPNRVNPNED